MSASSSRTSSPEARPRAGAVVVAGGSGRRMGAAAGGVRKQYLDLLGDPVLLWSVRAFAEHPAIDRTVVVLPPEDAAAPPGWLRIPDVAVAAGGAERGDSVRHGLELLGDAVDVVLIHDGARPLVPRAVIDRVLGAVGPGGAVAALPVTDTLKQGGADGLITGTPDRTQLWHAQTPQGFPLRRIRDAYLRARAEGIRATDDAALCERYGIPVRLVEGAPENLKITRGTDLVLAEALARHLRLR
jgi:2-C-methyl-D-erythritol 4-phosphate cytidylyltransferase